MGAVVVLAVVVISAAYVAVAILSWGRGYQTGWDEGFKSAKLTKDRSEQEVFMAGFNRGLAESPNTHYVRNMMRSR